MIFDGSFGRLNIRRKRLKFKAFLPVMPKNLDKYGKVRITAFLLFLERTGTILERTAERTE